MRLPEDDGVLPKHVGVNKEFNCGKYLDVSRLINEKQQFKFKMCPRNCRRIHAQRKIIFDT